METMNDRRIAICGPGRAGKDTAAKFFAEVTSLRYINSTSYAAVEYVRQRFAEEKGILFDSDLDCYNERFKSRVYWAQKIDEMNSVDPTTLYKKCLEYQDILTGIRKKREIKACRTDGVVDLVIWLERPGISVSSDPTQEFGPEECDVTIFNDTPFLLKSRIFYFASFCGLLKC